VFLTLIRELVLGGNARLTRDKKKFDWA